MITEINPIVIIPIGINSNNEQIGQLTMIISLILLLPCIIIGIIYALILWFSFVHRCLYPGFRRFLGEDDSHNSMVLENINV